MEEKTQEMSLETLRAIRDAFDKSRNSDVTISDAIDWGHRAAENPGSPTILSGIAYHALVAAIREIEMCHTQIDELNSYVTDLENEIEDYENREE